MSQKKENIVTFENFIISNVVCCIKRILSHTFSSTRRKQNENHSSLDVYHLLAVRGCIVFVLAYLILFFFSAFLFVADVSSCRLDEGAEKSVEGGRRLAAAEHRAVRRERLRRDGGVLFEIP